MIQIILTVIAVAVASAGCRSVRVAEDGRVAESMPLRAVAHNTRSPEMGKIYTHDGGRSMKVIQALKGGVLVRPVVGDFELEFRGRSAIDEKMTIYIETSCDYVDDEYLRRGLFEYNGRYTYTSVSGANVTVRSFREVPICHQ